MTTKTYVEEEKERAAATPGAMSINQAAKQGITVLKKVGWKHPLDHLVIDIITTTADEQAPGLWMQLYSPINEGIGNTDPVKFLSFMEGGIDLDAVMWLAYEGPRHGSTEYTQACSYAAGKFVK